MKSLLQAVAIATILATPIASFAQTSQPLTRAQVRAELVQLEQAGYNPATAGDNTTYPARLQAASGRLASLGHPGVANTSGYGASMSGSSQAGAAATSAAPAQAVYFGH
ncbi:DUF4148 domain-containing protein [Paraburkholderia hayleyella]|uniref:DUF4148 domain-containing protein n=1 Tax=Paraburkholderia hayleyella TaxID=2152889 RepID=UPI0012920D2A|nr:DUF4148 domain-containing protein [Paraburkholderia hayleyella]